MHSNRLSTILGWLLLTAGTAAAGPCGVLPEGRARLDTGGRELSIDSPVRIPCSGTIRLTQGTAVLTYARRSNVNEYRPLKLGETVDLSSIANESAASVSLDRILAFFQGDRRIEAVAAMSRAGERITGFPYDDVLLPQSDMQLRMLELQGKGLRVREFLLHPRGMPNQVLLRVDQETDAIVVPASVLAEGKEYGWLAKLSDGQEFSGKFRTLTRDEARRVESRLDEITRDPALSDSMRRTLTALTLDQNRLPWNRDMILAGLAIQEGRKP
jgi:hypothetical protein